MTAKCIFEKKPVRINELDLMVNRTLIEVESAQVCEGNYDFSMEVPQEYRSLGLGEVFFTFFYRYYTPFLVPSPGFSSFWDKIFFCDGCTLNLDGINAPLPEDSESISNIVLPDNKP